MTSTAHFTGQLTVMAETLIDANVVDYAILAIYFGFVLGIGLLARRHVTAHQLRVVDATLDDAFLDLTQEASA